MQKMLQAIPALPSQQLPTMRRWLSKKVKKHLCSRNAALRAVQDSSLQLELRSSQTDFPMVMLKRGCSVFVERGNNLIFVDSIQEVRGASPALGDKVLVCSADDRIIGWGVYNPNSVYRVRVLQSLRDCQLQSEAVLDISSVFEAHLKRAIELREILNLPSEETTVYRLVNSDGDNLSGVIVDMLGEIAVVHSGVSWLEFHRQLIIETLQRVLAVKTVVWRLRPVIHEQEGVPAATEGIYTKDGLLSLKSQVEVKENGILYNVSLSGQKTGFYSDQRDNRRFLQQVAQGKRVLDLCCYTGGFAINAAVGGAVEVLGVDSSQPAINLAESNAELNNVENVCSFRCGNILDVLQEEKKTGQMWDVVVLDPPKLAFSRTHQNKATGRYRKLNRAAMSVVRSGGLLMTCSCSGSISMEVFFKTVREAAEQLKRQMTVVQISGAAADHVFNPSHPEGNYLKCIVLRLT